MGFDLFLPVLDLVQSNLLAFLRGWVCTGLAMSTLGLLHLESLMSARAFGYSRAAALAISLARVLRELAVVRSAWEVCIGDGVRGFRFDIASQSPRITGPALHTTAPRNEDRRRLMHAQPVVWLWRAGSSSRTRPLAESCLMFVTRTGASPAVELQIDRALLNVAFASPRGI